MGLNGMTPNDYAVAYEEEDREFAWELDLNPRRAHHAEILSHDLA